MCSLRKGVFVLKRMYALTPFAVHCKTNINAQKEDLSIFTTRQYSNLKVTNNIEIISNDKIRDKINDLKLAEPTDNPMVVLLSWLMAKPKHVMKYASFYLEQGFDVLNVKCTPWQMMWPVKGTQLVAKDLLIFLEKNDAYKVLLLHGFSVGGYLWGEVMVHMLQDQKRYEPILDRIIGQIWDSCVDFNESQDGVSKAMFPKNLIMQNVLRQYLIYHLKKFHDVATKHYLRSREMFYSPLVHAPALIFVSEKDPLGTVKANQDARKVWESMGIKVSWKCFQESHHVGHYQKYPKEYITELYNFIDQLGLVQHREKIHARL